MSSLPPLLLTTILRYMPTARHHTLVCSAGSQGYHSLKEMLQSGVPGNTLLIESGDLREVVVPTAGDIEHEHAVLIYTFDEGNPTDPDYCGDVGYEDVAHVTLYTNLPSLPYGLLQGCTSLTSVDLSPLTPATTHIQSFFFSRCTGIKTIDLNSLSHMREIERYFLSGCRGLTSIDLNPLSQLSTIQSSFLSGCVGLKEIDLSPLSGVEIEGAFLQGCTGLTTIDLSPLSHMTVIHASFLEGCTGLTSIDLAPLNQVVTIHNFFMYECRGLEEVLLTPSVLTIDYGFLKKCPSMKIIDLRMSTLLEKLPQNFISTFKNTTTSILLPPHLEECRTSL